METEVKSYRSSYSYVDFLVLLVVILWGLNNVVVKISLKEMDPLLFNCLRYMIAAIVCWGILLVKERDYKIKKRDFINFILVGVVANGLNQVFFIYGVSKTTAGVTSIILASTPACVAFLANVIKLEKNSRSVWIGIAISFLGIILVVLSSGSPLSGGAGAAQGNLLIVLATIFWSLYTIMLRLYFKDLSIIKVSAYAISSTAAFFILISFKKLLYLDITAYSQVTWMGVLYSGIFVLGISYTLWNMGIQSLGPTRTATYANLPPFISSFVAWILLGEVITALQIVGGITIIAGLLYSNKSKYNSLPMEKAGLGVK